MHTSLLVDYYVLVIMSESGFESRKFGPDANLPYRKTLDRFNDNKISQNIVIDKLLHT